MKIRGRPVTTKLEIYLARCNKCTCGSHNLFVDNANGWTVASIRCRDCKRTVSGFGINEAIKNWNKSFKIFAETKENR